MSTGSFFAIDLHQFRHAVAQGVNPATAYLVLACFSGANNRHTTASVHAIERYTSISRGRATDAIADLMKVGLVKRLRGGDRPQYDLVPSRGSPTSRELIWLPNSIVVGAGNESPPLETLRQTQDRLLIRLFVDLYGAQDLVEELGIDRRRLWQAHTMVKLSERAEFTIWGYRSATTNCSWSPLSTPHRAPAGTPREHEATPFFARIGKLEGLGLLDWCPVVYESDDPSAEALVVCGGGPVGSIEHKIGTAAHVGGLALLERGVEARVLEQGLWTVPLPRHLDRVVVVGVARMRYRARTSKTAAWYAQNAERGQKWLARFTALGGGIPHEARKVAKC